MRYFFISILLLFGCGSAQLTKPPIIEPTIKEQQVAAPLNPCQRGKYYMLLEYKHDMVYYSNSNDEEIKLQAKKNLQEINELIERFITRSNKKQFKKQLQ
jgi:hypothetical protein